MPGRFLNLITCVALLGSPTAYLLAEDLPASDVENSKFKIAGVINSNAVFVRCGPSESDYATSKLEKGTEITAVGERATWLKIVPPQGSFCLVAKAFVNRAGSGNVGQVTSTINVRVGSDLNPMKSHVATQLDPGQQVQIVGEDDEYWKIAPPASVYLYVNKQFVDPIKPAIADAVPPRTPTAPIEPSNTPIAMQAGNPTTNPSTDNPGDAYNTALNTGNVPSTQPAMAMNMNAPATQASETAQIAFDKLEVQYGNTSTQPIDQQPVDEMLAGYKQLQADAALPESLKRVCDYKVAVLQNRSEIKGQLASAKQVHDSMKSKQDALTSEQKDLETRIKQADLQFYTACGTLRTSSLQAGQGGMLYRLTDPANGRTVVYLRSEDDKLGAEIGQFIGIKGNIAKDAALQFDVLSPTGEARVIDPAKVGQSIAAQMMPASLMPGVTASAAPASGSGKF